MGLISSVPPVICNLFRSIITTKLSRLYFEADVAASQTDPSDSSPSPSKVIHDVFFYLFLNPALVQLPLKDRDLMLQYCVRCQEFFLLDGL